MGSLWGSKQASEEKTGGGSGVGSGAASGVGAVPELGGMSGGRSRRGIEEISGKVKKPVILFYGFDGPFSCSIATENPK